MLQKLNISLKVANIPGPFDMNATIMLSTFRSIKCDSRYAVEGGANPTGRVVSGSASQISNSELPGLNNRQLPLEWDHL